MQIPREEPAPEQQYYFELQTPQEQAQAAQQAALNQHLHMAQQSPSINQNQVILQHSTPQQILVQQPQQTPPNQHYFLTTNQSQPQYFMPQTQDQVQTRIVYQSPPQLHQIQNPQQRTLVVQRQGNYSVPNPVRPQQIQLQQQIPQQMSGIRIIRSPAQATQIQTQPQRIQLQQQVGQRPVTIQQQVVQQQPAQVTPRPRASRPRGPRNQGVRMQRTPQIQQGIQQPSPQTIGQQKVIYRLAQPGRQVSPNTVGSPGGTQKIRLGNNIRLQIQGGNRLIVQQPGQHLAQQQVQQPQQVTRYVQLQGHSPSQPVSSPNLITVKKSNVQQSSEESDDIESSITAAIVTKVADAEEATQEFDGAIIQRPTGEIVVKSAVTGPQTAIRPASQLSSRTNEEAQERESAKMLVILKSGEQRLITFTLPKECCTVQELLEQVGVPFSSDSNIKCISNPGADIDYVVTVDVPVEDSNEMMAAAENNLKTQQQVVQSTIPQRPNTQQQLQNQMAAMQNHGKSPLFPGIKKPETPEPIKKDDVPPKYVKGYVAVCNYCGASSLDHAKCSRCKRVFKGDVKVVALQQQPLRPGQPIKTQDPNDKKPVQFVAKISPVKTVGRGEGTRGRGISNRGRGRGRAVRHEDPIVLTLSSDDEGDDSKASSSSNGNNKNGTDNNSVKNNVVTPLKCEPVVPETNEVPAGKVLK